MPLKRKGQAILYGPPGTGKTYTTRAFSVWWLQRRLASEAIAPLVSGSPAFSQAEQRLSTSQVGQKAWWVVASPKEWSWDRLARERTVTFEYGRLRRNYPLVRKGDLVFGYQSTPDKRLVALARVGRELFTDKDGKPKIELETVAAVPNGLTYDELRQDETLRESEPMRNRCQGTLFALTDAEFDHVSSLLIDRNPELRNHLEATGGVGPLTRLTFHPSYSYEDFIEGFRPVDAKGGNLALRLEDGVFKRVCREAQANPTQTYLVIIDEINRANVAKVFGEIITLLEKDKRGLQVSLPQSREPFNIPPNVFVLGTMNTADRSIKLLDVALRRRFAFIELMPDSELLAGGQVGNLALDDFLDRLNERIAAREGREKQIGHSFLMEGNTAISEPAEFARRFRQEVLPLLQEFCYEDYGVLADYIGETLVNRKAQTLNQAVLGDADQLVAALAAEFDGSDRGGVMTVAKPLCPVVKLEEWQSCHLDGLQLNDEDRRLARLLDDSADARIGVDELRTGLRVSAKSWVGVVRFSGFELHVQPKLVGDSLGLVNLIDFASGLDCLDRHPAVHDFHSAGTSLFDLIALLFAESCERLVKHGLLADYREVDDDLPVLRGRLLLREQVLRRFGRIDRLECRFDEQVTDTLDNQIVLAGLIACASKVGDDAVRLRVRRLLTIFSETCSLDSFDLRAAGLAVVYNRLNGAYREPHSLAWLVLGGLGVEDVYAAGAQRCFAFLLDMNRLFEDFVTRWLSRIVRTAGLRVLPQRRDRTIIRNADLGTPYASVIPDILVERLDAPGKYTPVDAKYKLYDDKSISPADVYQTFLYAFAYEGAGELPSAVLLYPASSVEGRRVRLHVHRAGGDPGAELRAYGIHVPTALAEATSGVVGKVGTTVLSILSPSPKGAAVVGQTEI